jgi:tetratricopeptide (TPR) repeat protein
MLSAQMPPLEAINQLSMAKGNAAKDELSGRPASLMLTLGPLRFYYGDEKTAQLDYATLRHIAPLLQTIREEESAGGNTAERAIRAAKVRSTTVALAEACGNLAATRNRAHQHDIANPAALRYLRALGVLFGAQSVELIPGYLALAESCLGLGALRAASASEMLFTATSILSSAAQAGAEAGAGHHHALHARLQLLYGRLHLSQGKAAEALENFARAVYRAACSGGPEHVGAAPCYFAQGKAFEACGKGDNAMACFSRAVDIYAAHIEGKPHAGAVATGFSPPPAPAPGTVDAAFAPSPPGSALNASEDADAGEALQAILAARERGFGPTNLAVAEVQWLLARLHLLQGRRDECLACIDKGIVDIFSAALVSFPTHCTLLSPSLSTLLLVWCFLPPPPPPH